MKKFLVLLMAGSGCGIAGAQTVDSVSNGSMSVPSETVTIVDTTATNVSPASSYSGTATETIRVYSGSHSGNNIVRTYKVPLPENNATRREQPY